MKDDDVYQIDLRFECEPPSVQSSRSRKDVFLKTVRTAIERYPFIIVDDVTLQIEWIMHECGRYESDRKADIDNILKPLFDSLSGPDGLLVDDTVIQSFHCAWIDHTLDSDVLWVRIQSINSESINEVAINRKSLVFVEIDRNLYFPLDDQLPAEFRRRVLKSIQDRIPVRDMIRNATNSYFAGQYVMPIQRLFHRSRIVRFPHFSLTDYLALLDPET